MKGVTGDDGIKTKVRSPWDKAINTRCNLPNVTGLDAMHGARYGPCRW